MAEKRIKFRLFHYYEQTQTPTGETALIERQGHFGETVDITREEDIARGEELGAFFTDEELGQIEQGTYEGPEAGALQGQTMVPPFTQEEADRAVQPGISEVQAPQTSTEPGAMTATATTPDLSGMDSEELADYIRDNKLTAPQTVALAGDDPELAERLMDAETMAMDNEPRKSVEDGLQKIIDKHLGE